MPQSYAVIQRHLTHSAKELKKYRTKYQNASLSRDNLKEKLKNNYATLSILRQNLKNALAAAAHWRELANKRELARLRQLLLEADKKTDKWITNYRNLKKEYDALKEKKG